MTKRLIAIHSVLLGSLFLLGCDKTNTDSSQNNVTTAASSVAVNTTVAASSAIASTASVAQQDPKSQLFTVGIDATYPPYDFRDENGQATGFDVDIIKAIGEKQNFKVNVLPKDWDTLMSDLEQSKFDMAISGFSRTDEREQKYLVSNTYGYGQDVVAFPEGKYTITSSKDLKNYSVALQADTPYTDQLKGYGVNKFVFKPSSFLAFKALVNGEANVMVADRGVMLYFLKGYPNAKMQLTELTEEDFQRYDLVILAPKQNTELMQKVNQGIKQIVEDGTYTKIYKKWFGIEPQPQNIPKVS